MKCKTLDIVFKTLGRIKVLGQNANATATSEQSDSRDDFVKNRGNAVVELRFFCFCLFVLKWKYNKIESKPTIIFVIVEQNAK